MSQYMRKEERKRKRNKKKEKGRGERIAVARAKKKKKRIEVRENETPQIGKKGIRGSKKLTTVRRVKFAGQTREKTRTKRERNLRTAISIFFSRYILIDNCILIITYN